jgi:hypothetical protein
VTVGASTSNKGVGNIPLDGPEFGYVIEDSDPASATYGKMLSAQVGSASAMPATGTYVQGHFVANSAVAGPFDPLGWIRLTTGSAHVSGTDWSPVLRPVNVPSAAASEMRLNSASGQNAQLTFFNGGSLKWFWFNNAGGGNSMSLWDQVGSTSPVSIFTGGAVRLGVAGAAGGPVTHYGASIDGSGVRTTLTVSGYAVPANTSLVRFIQASTVATATVTLPTASGDGHAIQFVNYAGAVTALTFSPAVAGWSNGATLAANTGVRIRWDATAAAWQREQ